MSNPREPARFNREGGHTGKHLFDVHANVLCLLRCGAAAMGQTLEQSVVLIRNVRVADAEGATTVADVLVVAGKFSRVSVSFPAPAGALVIDGGGSRLTLDDDGQIKLTPAFAAERSCSHSGKLLSDIVVPEVIPLRIGVG
jgi:hypothetical protein